MAEGTVRRPLPALICLLALTLLTALVWWRVLNRGNGHADAKSTCTSTSTQVVLPQPAGVSLTVLNSTNRTGIAKTTAAALGKDGFKIVTYGNDTGHAPVAGVAEIRFSADLQTGATLLSYYLPGARMVALDPNSDSKLVLALGAKYTKLATASQARLAMTDAHVSQVPAGSTSAPSKPTPSC